MKRIPKGRRRRNERGKQPAEPGQPKFCCADDWPTMFIVTVGKWRVPFKLVSGAEFFSRDGGKNGYYVAAVTGADEVRISDRADGEDLERAIGRAILSLSGDAVGMQRKGGDHA